MNEVATRTPDIIAVEIRSVDSHARSVLLVSCMEIGQRLVEAKDLLPHGEWGDWLKNAVNYSQSTANNLMQLYREYGNGKFPTLTNLSYTKAIALLGVPEEEREIFATANDVENKSAAEIKRLIKERDEVLESNKSLNSQLGTAQETAAKLKLEKDKLQATLESEQKAAKSNVDRLNKLLKKAKGNGASDARLQQLGEELLAAQAQVQELTERINQPITLEPTVVEKIPEETERELAELRQKTKELEVQAKQNCPAAQKYAAHFDVLVNSFKNLLASLAEIQDTQPELHEKYRSAVIALIEKMSDKL